MNTRAWLNAAMHAGFFLLLAASAARLVARHQMDGLTVASLVLCAVLAVVYGSGVAAWNQLGSLRNAWLISVLILGLALVLMAPSFSWCVVPLYFLSLRLLPIRAVMVVAVGLTAAVVAGQLRLATVIEPSLVLAPVGIAAMITVVFWALERESSQRQALIDDLVDTRGTLAESQHRLGTLEERERLAREIHDTLAQGLSSIGMLLQAAERSWDGRPQQARQHVERAAAVAGENLAEARRFVADLSPSRLEESTLPQALRELCAEQASDRGIAVNFRIEGAEYPVDARREAVLLRVAQGALANVAEHSGAGSAVMTLSYLSGELTLDLFDDGVGFDSPEPEAGRGHGLPSMRRRLAEVGGSLTVESTPSHGTVVAASIPRGDI